MYSFLYSIPDIQVIPWQINVISSDQETDVSINWTPSSLSTQCWVFATLCFGKTTTLSCKCLVTSNEKIDSWVISDSNLVFGFHILHCLTLQTLLYLDTFVFGSSFTTYILLFSIKEKCSKLVVVEITFF